MDAEQIKNRVDQLQPFFHYFNLNGVETKPEGLREYREGRHYPQEQFSPLEKHLADVKGKNCLDIGCNSGFHSFELARRGAVVRAVDVDVEDLHGKQIALVKEVTSLDVSFQKGDFLEIESDEPKYDIVLFLGVYYHMPKPELAIPKLSKIIKAGGVLFLETATAPQPERYGDNGRVYDLDPTNFLIPSRELILRELADNGFEVCQILEYHRLYIKAVKQ